MRYANNIGPPGPATALRDGVVTIHPRDEAPARGPGHQPQRRLEDRGAAAFRGRQGSHVPRRRVEVTCPGTLSTESSRQASLRLHGAPRNDAVLSTMKRKSETVPIGSEYLHDLLTVEEASERLKLAPKTVRKLCVSRRLTAIRIRQRWRIPAMAIDEFLRERIVPRV